MRSQLEDDLKEACLKHAAEAFVFHISRLKECQVRSLSNSLRDAEDLVLGMLKHA